MDYGFTQTGMEQDWYEDCPHMRGTPVRPLEKKKRYELEHFSHMSF